MTDPRPAESALSRRTGHAPAAPVAGASALTRAELRRRAAATATPVSAADEAPVLTRRQARTRTAPVVTRQDAPVEGAAATVADLGPEVAVAALPDLAPEALEVPAVVDKVDVDATVLAEDVHRVASEAPDAQDPADAPADVDEFAAAARLFSFTGETPVQVAAAALADEPATADPEPRRGFSFRRTATASFSLGVIGVVGLLTVGMTTPVEAVAVAQGGAEPVSILAPGDVAPEDAPIQAYVAPAQVHNQEVVRSDGYEATTIAQMAAESGIKNFSNLFVNNPDSPIQWPFAVGVPMTYGFGMRSGTMHEGIDFTPGAGSPVQAIADGTVRVATESGGAYGVTVVIDHVIDGELVSSRYAHMQYGSLQVEPGQQVTVGTFIGRTGNTGRSYGAHTHFEILMNGTTAIDPLPWLREHAGG